MDEKQDQRVYQLVQNILEYEIKTGANGTATFKKVPKKSLLYHFIKSTKYGHLMLEDEILLPSDKDLDAYRLEVLQDCQQKGGVVATRLSPIKSIYGSEFLLNVKFLDRYIIRNVVLWKLGRLYAHQTCIKCGAIVTYNHGITCADVRNRLVRICKKYHWRWSYRTAYGTLNPIDSILWQMESGTPLINVYKSLGKIIEKIKVKVLGHKSSQTAKTGNYAADDDPQEYYNKCLAESLKSFYAKRQRRSN